MLLLFESLPSSMLLVLVGAVLSLEVGPGSEPELSLVLVCDLVVEDAEDCGAVWIGDHNARAIAEKVDVGGEPSQPRSPQHSHNCAVRFH